MAGYNNNSGDSNRTCDDIDTSNLPSDEECGERYQLESSRSYRSYFQLRSTGAAPPLLPKDNLRSARIHDTKHGHDTLPVDFNSQKSGPGSIRILSWNIDGLDERNLATRTTSACEQILRADADVVLLQEVIAQSRSIIDKKLGCCYTSIYADGERGSPYFTGILLKNKTCTYISHNIVNFDSSNMLRNLLVVEADVKGVESTVMTSHLESMAASSKERKNQLSLCFDVMKAAPPTNTVFFGGDLNIRDHEITSLGGLPKNIVDLWVEGGQRQNAKYTWDLTLNDNLPFDGDSCSSDSARRSSRPRTRCRFDRIYLRHPLPLSNRNPASLHKHSSQTAHQTQGGAKTATESSDTASNSDDNEETVAKKQRLSNPGGRPKVRVVYFELVGISRIQSIKRFPSDHWGILGHLPLL